MTFMPSLPDTGVRPLARQRFDTAIVILTAANAISAVTESAGGAGAGPETLPRCFVVRGREVFPKGRLIYPYFILFQIS